MTIDLEGVTWICQSATKAEHTVGGDFFVIEWQFKVITGNNDHDVWLIALLVVRTTFIYDDDVAFAIITAAK